MYVDSIISKSKRTMNVDQAFKVVGAFGKHQAILFLSIAASGIFVAFQMVLMVFVGATPTIKTTSRGKMEVVGMETIVDEWNLRNDRQYIVDLVQSLFMFGVLIGNLFIGQLSDTYGRKPVYFRVLLLLILLSFSTSLASDWRLFAALRFLTGICQGGVGLVAFVMAQELVGTSVWTMTGNFLAMLFAVGMIILAGLASLFTNWRHLCIVTSVPGLLLLLNYWIMPESPRWLYSQGKVSAAEEVLQCLARKNGVPEADVNSIILERMKEERKTHKRSYTFRDLFSSKNLIKRTLIMAYCWFVCSFNYYALTMNAKDLVKSLYVSVALSGLVEIPGCILCAPLMNQTWAGRRKALIGFMISAAVSCIGIMMLPDASQKTTARTVLALIGKMTITAAFSLIYIYATELYPTVVRNVGMGSSSVCARIGGMLSPFVHALNVYGDSIPYVLYGLASLVAAVLVVALPETLNQPVPNTLEDLVLENGQHVESVKLRKRKKRIKHVKATDSEDQKQLLDSEDEEEYSHA